jgi:hypothetical protein
MSKRNLYHCLIQTYFDHQYLLHRPKSTYFSIIIFYFDCVSKCGHNKFIKWKVAYHLIVSNRDPFCIHSSHQEIVSLFMLYQIWTNGYKFNILCL